jgi:hypothetical protein
VSDQSTLQSAIRLGTNLISSSTRQRLVKPFFLQVIIVYFAGIIFMVILGLTTERRFFLSDLFNVFLPIATTSTLSITWAIVWIISYITPRFKQSFLPVVLNRESSIASDSISEFITLRAGLAPKQQREADKLVTMAAIDERVARLGGRKHQNVVVLQLHSRYPHTVGW